MGSGGWYAHYAAAAGSRTPRSILRGVEIRALTWNLFHGRDFPPDPSLFTWRSRLLRVTERGSTHVQVNRDLLEAFSTVLSRARWDLALLQECPPRWAASLAAACDADGHRSLTARNALGLHRSALARWNPDLLGSWEGGSNLTLIRDPLRQAGVRERRELVLRRRPERRTMAFARVGGLCVANLHASTAAHLAQDDLRRAADAATAWAGDDPLLFGGDFNVTPRNSSLFEEIAERHGLVAPTAPDSIDHILARGSEIIAPARIWPAEARELPSNGLRVRLSDHAPVEVGLRTPGPDGVAAPATE
jgi:endonuclease/exonuclease/phosphatase family metal-dependent hydrolase